MSLEGRTGLFGGTFNPIHIGHLRVAEGALRQFRLRQVLFIPTGIPPHRAVADGVGGEVRYQMVKLAVEGQPGMAVSRAELDRDGPAYTVDTIELLSREHPEGVAYLVGADIFSQIEIWRDWPRLLTLCPFIVAPRPGVDLARFRLPPFDRAEIYVVAIEPIALSSSEVRRRYRLGLPTKGLVPEAVDRFIRERGLYGAHGDPPLK